MAKSIVFILGFILVISFSYYEVLSIDSLIWHKTWHKFCIKKLADEGELEQLKQCDTKLTKERKSLLSFCIDGVDSPLSDQTPKLCQIPNDWSADETKLFYNCMSKNLTKLYKNNPKNMEKEFDFDLCITKLLAPNGWENLCIASNVPKYRAKMKACADTHPMIKKPIKECVASDPVLKSKIANVLPIPCQLLNHIPKLKACIDKYELNLSKNTELYEKYQARGISFLKCLKKIGAEARENKLAG